MLRKDGGITKKMSHVPVGARISLLEWDKQLLQKGKADRTAAIFLFLWE